MKYSLFSSTSNTITIKITKANKTNLIKVKGMKIGVHREGIEVV